MYIVLQTEEILIQNKKFLLVKMYLGWKNLLILSNFVFSAFGASCDLMPALSESTGNILTKVSIL